MNSHGNKSDPRARLVAETFHDDWAGGPTATFARRAAAHARTRRTARRVIVAAGAVTALALAFFVSTRRTPLAPSTAPAVTLASTSAARSLASATPFAPKTPAYEIISDAEFEALLSDRPLLILPQQGGAKKFVLLDR